MATSQSKLQKDAFGYLPLTSIPLNGPAVAFKRIKASAVPKGVLQVSVAGRTIISLSLDTVTEHDLKPFELKAAQDKKGKPLPLPNKLELSLFVPAKSPIAADTDFTVELT